MTIGRIPRLAGALALALTVQLAGAQQNAAPAASAGTSSPKGLAMCEGCHGIEGYKTAFPTTYHVPMIGGQQPAYIVNALKAYKSGERTHPSMRGIAASLTEKDMEAFAAYYGSKK